MKSISILLVAASLAMLPSLTAQIAWKVETTKSGPEVSPVMHGIFFEDINYAGDGGLYAELIDNRSFEHEEALHAWLLVKHGAAEGKLDILDENPIHPNNPSFLHLDITTPGDGCGVSNSGYEGIPVTAGEAYRFSTYSRSTTGYTGSLTVQFVSQDGKTLAEGKIDKLGSEWKKDTLMLTPSATDAKAMLVLLADAAGSLDLDMVSLFPKNTFKQRENGLRADLAEHLAAMKPGFMRFPGGCIIEGFDLANAYRWKDGVGDVAHRKQNWNRWKQDDKNRPDHHYHQTYGLGFFEFFQLCEDIHTEPVPVLNCGMACQFQSKELVPLDQLDPWVQDALDLIEFANGPTTSNWGKIRAEMGHPEPFHLKYLGIGNEQWGEEYFKRYEVFYQAIHAKYPDILLITTSGPGVDDGNWDYAWDRFKNNTSPAEIVDEHYYRPLEWMINNANRYDSYERKGPKVFAGEFAAHRRDRANALDSAICEAALMTGLLRNADLVRMSCYAPLFAREGFVQWKPDMIWFDATRSFVTPNYHVQALFSQNRPDAILPSTLLNNMDTTGLIGKAGVGTWLTQAEFRDITITSGGKTIFSSPNGKGMKPGKGTWRTENGSFQQTSNDENTAAFADTPPLHNYTLTLKARKTGGNEGFFIPVCIDEGVTKCLWNLGGWGNTRHAVEFNGKELGTTEGKIENDRWYDLRVDVRGRHITCSLDGKVIHQVDCPSRDTLFAVAGVDSKTKEVILQITNPTGKPQELQIKLDGWKATLPAKGSVLNSASPDDVNSFAEPDKVAPKPITVPLEGDRIRTTLPAWSLTTLRVPQ